MGCHIQQDLLKTAQGILVSCVASIFSILLELLLVLITHTQEGLRENPSRKLRQQLCRSVQTTREYHHQTSHSKTLTCSKATELRSKRHRSLTTDMRAIPLLSPTACTLLRTLFVCLPPRSRHCYKQEGSRPQKSAPCLGHRRLPLHPRSPSCNQRIAPVEIDRETLDQRDPPS